MIGVSDLSKWSIGGRARASRAAKRRGGRYESGAGFETLEIRAVMDGSPFGGGGGGPYQEPTDLGGMSAAQVLQLLVDMNLTTKDSVAELVQTLDFDDVFTSMTNVEVMLELMRLDLVRDYADIDDFMAAVPAAGVDLTTLRPDGLLTSLAASTKGSFLTVTAETAKQDFENLFVAAPLTFLNVFDTRNLLELFDDRIVSTPGAAIDTLYAIPWTPTQDGLNYILKAYQIDNDLDNNGNPIIPSISGAVQELNAMPAGSRAIVSRWIGFEGYGSDDGGVTMGMVDPMDGFGNPAEFYTIWSDSWQELIYAKYDSWFGQLKAAGGQVDTVILDIEAKDFSWSALKVAPSNFTTPTGRTVWQTIKEDPRWGEVKAQLVDVGLTNSQLDNIANWNANSIEMLRWDAVMERRRADYMNHGIYDALRKHFPDVRFSNYGNYQHAQTVPSGLYSRFTHTWLNLGSIVGTSQARPMYAWPRAIVTPTAVYESSPPSNAAIHTIHGVNGLVTVTTYTDITGVRAGDPIRVYEPVPRGIDMYIGLYTVHQVLGPNKFTFLKPGNYPLVTLANNNATGTAEFFNSYNAMIHDMKYVRSQVASSTIGLQPWMGAPGYSDVTRDLPFTYWTEQMLHVGLHDVEEVMFWNSARAGMDPQGQGNVMMNSALAELQPLIGYADRQGISFDEADWNAGYLLSGMEANGKRIWRFTPDPKYQLSISTGTNTTFTINGNTVTIPNSTIYTPSNAVSNKGYWVIQTAGTTHLTGTVDQVLALLAEGAGGGSTGEGSVLPVSLGQWNPNLTWVDVRTGDFDGDGDHDIVGRSQSSGEWWIGRVTGATMSPELWGVWSPAVTWLDVNVGDFNGDGRDDLVGRATSSGDWWIARSTGNGFVSEFWGHWSTTIGWQNVAVDDVDGDGKDDLIGRALQSGDWWVGRSSGAQFTNQLWGNFSTGLTWTSVQVRDFTGDGKADVAARSVTDGGWWVGVSNGSQFVNTAYGVWSAAVTWGDVLFGDFDGDGDNDALGKVTESGQWWLAQSGGNRFTNVLWGSWPYTIDFDDLRVLDLNADGRDDVVARVAGTGAWWKGLSQPQGMSYQYLGSRPESVDYLHKLVMDLDGDGHDDDFVGMAAATGDWWWDF